MARCPPRPAAATTNRRDWLVSVSPPLGELVVRERLGLVTAPAVDAQVVYATGGGAHVNTRAIRAPRGGCRLIKP